MWRPSGPAWKPAIAAIRASVVDHLQEAIGGDNDPLAIALSIAADVKQPVEIRLGACGLAIPVMYPKLSAAVVIRNIDPNVTVQLVIASRGKAVRAEPVATAYEQGKVHHVGVLPVLEDQLVSWDPDGNDPSPDRLDALVWCITELMSGWNMRFFAVWHG